jgi:dephospho-CoA kinase
MENQLNEDKFRAAADVVIDNSKDEENTLQQIKKIPDIKKI